MRRNGCSCRKDRAAAEWWSCSNRARLRRVHGSGRPRARRDPGHVLRGASAGGCDSCARTLPFVSGTGLTCALILSESHAVLHTWPETGTINIDIFSCSTRLKSLEAIDELKSSDLLRNVSVLLDPEIDPPDMCHNVHMKTISIRELHLKTGQWVRLAASRGPIVVTDRGRRVAALQPFDASTTGRPLPNREAAIRKRSKIPVDSVVYQSELREDR
jgi:antitoxin (DNA-binding transcriptional repressor) of toxin-antitoxin stability system